MAKQKAKLTALGEINSLNSASLSFVNPPMISAPNSTVTDLSGSVRQLPDPSKTLRPAIAVERIMTHDLVLMENERGANGENVYGAMNDDTGRIRFVGSWEVVKQSTYGRYLQSLFANDYIEIAFMGTGLNLLQISAGSARDFRATVDGGTESGNLFTVHADVLGNRLYSANLLTPIVSNLAYGLHTVKIRVASSVISMCGIEILNESVNVKTPQGEIIANGSKYNSATAQSVAYNASFDGNPSLNGRGGRVIEYISQSGTIGKVINQVNSSAAFYTSADHSNEELARAPIHWREFGIGRTDDFNTLTTTAKLNAFTLADGTTTMVSSTNAIADLGGGSSVGGLFSNATNDFITFTFVGSGVDLRYVSQGTVACAYSIIVDGVTVQTGVTGLAKDRTLKIASGLQYGSHTVKIMCTNFTGIAMQIWQWLVYQPKKPAIPANAVELADYCMMATFDGSGVTGTTLIDNMQMPVGGLFKAPMREFIYIGANQQFFSIDPNIIAGLSTTTLANNTQPITYAFIGNAFLLHMASSVAGTYDFTVTVDTVLNATGVARSNASNLGSGSYRSTNSAQGNLPVRIEFSGLSYGLHTISIQKTAGTGNFTFQGLHIASLVHTYRNIQGGCINNESPIGTGSISTSAKLTPSTHPSRKSWSMTLGTTGYSTTFTTPVPVPEMTLIVPSGADGKRSVLEISWSVSFTNNQAAGAGRTYFQAAVNGVLVGAPVQFDTPNGSSTICSSSGFASVEVAPGIHKVDVYWYVLAGTSNIVGASKLLRVKEV
jgi:hypothetical protein